MRILRAALLVAFLLVPFRPASAAPAFHIPDARIQADGDGATFVGEDLYDPPDVQNRTLMRRPGRQASFFVHANNDGNVNDAYTAKGCRSRNGYVVRYTEEPSDTNVTGAVVNGSYVMDNSVSPASETANFLEVKIVPRATAARSLNCAVTVNSQGGVSGQHDKVHAIVKRER